MMLQATHVEHATLWPIEMPAKLYEAKNIDTSTEVWKGVGESGIVRMCPTN